VQDELTATGINSWHEIFGLVADPRSGAAVRVYDRVLQSDADPVTLGLIAAHKLFEAGAGPMLKASEGGLP
jgi:threonine synthase